MFEIVKSLLKKYIFIKSRTISISSGVITPFWAPPEGFQSLLQHLPNLWRRRDNPADASILVVDLKHKGSLPCTARDMQ